MAEYLTASEYFRSIGLQSPNTEYGGSRALIYYQMLGRASSIRGMVEARKSYLNLHTGPCPSNDEKGALLRIAAFRLRNVPFAGNKLARMVRDDDPLMVNAGFIFPEGYDRVTGDINELKQFVR